MPARASELLALGPDRLLELLVRSRPRPIDDAGRRAALQVLPRQGEVTDLTPAALEKIHALSPVLRAADRAGAYVIKVVDVPQAAAGNHQRAVLVLSKPLVDLLTPGELQAIVAHELAHEYVWPEYEAAQRRGDTRRVRELELVCDALAVLLLWTAGVAEAALPDAVEKISRFNRRHFGAAVNEAAYPSPGERRALARALARALEPARKGPRGG
jgi:hypothetical protein